MSEASDVIPFPEREEMELKRPQKVIIGLNFMLSW